MSREINALLGILFGTMNLTPRITGLHEWVKNNGPRGTFTFKFEGNDYVWGGYDENGQDESVANMLATTNNALASEGIFLDAYIIQKEGLRTNWCVKLVKQNQPDLIVWHVLNDQGDQRIFVRKTANNASDLYNWFVVNWETFAVSNLAQLYEAAYYIRQNLVDIGEIPGDYAEVLSNHSFGYQASYRVPSEMEDFPPFDTLGESVENSYGVQEIVASFANAYSDAIFSTLDVGFVSESNHPFCWVGFVEQNLNNN